MLKNNDEMGNLGSNVIFFNRNLIDDGGFLSAHRHDHNDSEHFAGRFQLTRESLSARWCNSFQRPMTND